MTAWINFQIHGTVIGSDTIPWIIQDNDYVLPDYDSLSFAKDMERDFHIYFQTDRVKVLKSDDAPLSDAMEPAIRIECNIPDDKEMESFLEQYLRQIFAKENEELW